MRLSRSTTVWGPTRVWHEWGPHSFPRLSHVPPSGPCPLLSYLCSRARCEPGLLPVLCVGQVSSHPPLGIAGHPVRPARAAPQDWRAGAAGRPGDHLAGAPAIGLCAQSCGGYSLGPGRPGHGDGGIWGAGDSGNWPGVPGSRLDSRVPEHLMRTKEFCPQWVPLTTALGRSHGGFKPQGRLCSGLGGSTLGSWPPWIWG